MTASVTPAIANRACVFQRLTTLLDNVEFFLIRDKIDHFDIVENLTKRDFALSRMIISNIKCTNM